MHKRAGQGSFDIVHIAALAYSYYVHTQRMKMKELVNCSELSFAAVNAAVVSSHSYLAQKRDTATSLMRPLIRGIRLSHG